MTDPIRIGEGLDRSGSDRWRARGPGPPVEARGDPGLQVGAVAPGGGPGLQVGGLDMRRPPGPGGRSAGAFGGLFGGIPGAGGHRGIFGPLFGPILFGPLFGDLRELPRGRRWGIRVPTVRSRLFPSYLFPPL